MKSVWKYTSVIMFVCKMTLLFTPDLPVQTVSAYLFRCFTLAQLCICHDVRPT